MMRRMCARVLVLLFPLLAALTAAGEEDIRISQFSGKPVPRFESLAYTAVNGRTGPSQSHPIAWRYERRGLPVLVVKESVNWRRVRDPDGDEVWVHARMLSEARTAMVRRPATLRAEAAPAARPLAELSGGLVVKFGGCSGTWCRVVAGRHQGYVERLLLWGSAADDGTL